MDIGTMIFEFIWGLFDLGFTVNGVFVSFKDILIYSVIATLICIFIGTMLGGD